MPEAIQVGADQWRVETVNLDNDVTSVGFTGPGAEALAREYVALLNSGWQVSARTFDLPDPTIADWWESERYSARAGWPFYRAEFRDGRVYVKSPLAVSWLPADGLFPGFRWRPVLYPGGFPEEVDVPGGVLLPKPNEHGNYRYPDGSVIVPAYAPGKWKAFWADRTPLRGDATGNELISVFNSPEQAAKALLAGGEGPACFANMSAGSCGDADSEQPVPTSTGPVSDGPRI